MNFQLENPPAGNWRAEDQQSGRATVMPNSTTLTSTNTADSPRRAWPISQKHVEALVWASWGLEVHPLREDGKIPRLKAWQHHTTTDLETINKWWAMWPDANIGSQPPHWAIVLDVDVKNGGLTTWQEVTGGADYPTDTLVTITGTGGAHVWYRLPYSGDLNRSFHGIDFQRRGMQLVMPGSVNPKTGKPYRCVNWCDPAELPELPHMWRKYVYRPLRPARPVIPVNLRGGGSGLVKFVEQLQESERNNGLFWAVCAALEDGLDIVDDLAAAGESIGLTATEVQATVRSAHNKISRRMTGQEVA